ncbi:12411_t:CDS:2, partial [Dentiscutata heterogama]
MVGDSTIGKTSLMHKFTEGDFDVSYDQTNGVQFIEKTITLRGYKFRFSRPEFISYVCDDSVAILFMFDLSQISTLYSIKEWYKQTRSFNKNAIYFLIGTKHDIFKEFEKETQCDITNKTRHYAIKMKASLIFCSSKHFINVEEIFKVILSKHYNLNCKLLEIKEAGYPILEYKNKQETD